MIKQTKYNDISNIVYNDNDIINADINIGLRCLKNESFQCLISMIMHHIVNGKKIKTFMATNGAHT